ncbi:MAG: ATP-dependent DNA helicase [Minisyncoccia bacterium]
MNFDERYKALNREQKMAVDKIDGPLLVIAGPGSGKTEILSLRVGKILKDTDTRASNILCLTFTESATLNMRKRLASLIGSEAYRVAIHTFHNFCVEIIQKYPQYFYSGAFFSSADSLTQVQVLEELFENLPHNHLLSSYHPEQGFVYLKSVLNVIGYLKKAGLTPDEFHSILEHNKKSLMEIDKILTPVFSERIGKESLGNVSEVLEKLNTLALKSEKGFSIAYFVNSLFSSIRDSLKIALEEANDLGKATPLSAWKQKWMKKDDEGGSIFKDSVNIEKLLAVGDIYAKYRKTMHEKGYYDFDDMILDVLKALEENPSLRYEIQEQYQYILVDEFQDTNEAQMRLLLLISDAPVNEGKPNIMAVGDDDQAVYKFQGAELSNILNFKKIFRDVEIVTMTKNYRSSQDILDIASHIIRKGEERLEKLLPEIEKNLIASNKEIKKGNIIHKEFKTVAHEYHFISREIKKKIDAGAKPEEIAVIARKHKQLETLVPYLRGAKVPIRYEREQNVFKEPHIAQIIIIARFLSSLIDKHKDEADEFMPQILSFPFWQINREDIWQVSLNARKNYPEKNWLETMLDHKNNNIKNIAKFFIDLGVRSQSEPLEKILDDIIGAHLPLTEENEDDDNDEFFAAKNSSTQTKFESPFREFYFNKEKFNHARAEYLSFLSSLRVFVGALREYKSGEILSIKDLVEFVDLHDQNDISLNDQSPFAKLDNAVNLLTAHKAKGLEFETVFVLSCQDDIWARGGIPNKIVLPANLPIEPAGDTEDDQLRLFYVALTRAKRFLYMTSYLIKEDGDSSDKLRFLIAENGEEDVMKKEILKKIYFESESIDDEVLPDAHEVLTASWLQYHTPPFVGSEEKLLKSLLTDYEMPITHLNNFLDVEKGGPQYFLEQNLLRFPQAKNTSSSYGSAIHHTLEKFSLFLKKEGRMAEIPETLSWFKYFLIKERMSPKDFEKNLEKGQDDLDKFLKNKKDGFSPKDIIEFNFKDQGVMLGGAHLSGKIDRIMEENSGEYKVCDYKTGKPLLSWTSGSDYEKAKAIKYERQIIYYKLLLEGSREFGRKGKVKSGVLQFIEPKNGKIFDLNLIIEDEKVEKLKKLITVIYNKIINLDFPDVSKYSKDTKGSQRFVDDLIEGKI